MQITRCFLQLLLHKKNNKNLKYVESFDMTKLLYGKSVEKYLLKEVSFVFQCHYNFIKSFKQEAKYR